MEDHHTPDPIFVGKAFWYSETDSTCESSTQPCRAQIMPFCHKSGRFLPGRQKTAGKRGKTIRLAVPPEPGTMAPIAKGPYYPAEMPGPTRTGFLPDGNTPSLFLWGIVTSVPSPSFFASMAKRKGDYTGLIWFRRWHSPKVPRGQKCG